MSDLLTVRGLRLGFGKTEVVHGVDLQVLERSVRARGDRRIRVR